MATYGQPNDDVPVRNGSPFLRAYDEPESPALTAANEELLFELVHIGGTALDELTRCATDGIHDRLASIGQSHFPSPTLNRAIAKCIRQVLIQHALKPVDAVECGESLARALRGQLSELLSAKDGELECRTAASVAMTCDESVIQSSIPLALWRMNGEWHSLALREHAIREIIQHHLPLARSVAQAKKRNPNEFDDLVNEAVLILRHAVERFDTAVGVRFGSYAKTILLRELRRQYDAAMGLTRHSADQVAEFHQTNRKLTQLRGQPVSIDDVHNVLGHSQATRKEIENIRRLMLAERSSSASDSAAQRLAVAAQLPQQLNVQENDLRRRALLSAFGKLTRLEKRIVVGVEVCGQSFRDLAKRYKKSPRNLSQMHKAALKILASCIDPDRIPSKPR